MTGSITAGLSRILTRESGLFGICEKIRNFFPVKSQLWEIVNCPLCFGFWCQVALGALAVLVLGLPIAWVFGVIGMGVGIAYALLGLASMIQ